MKFFLGLAVNMLLLAFLLTGCAHQFPEESAERPFVYASDHFAFANETVWHYSDGQLSSVSASAPPEKGQAYSRRCFVLTRASVQFWKFARFAPGEPPLSSSDLVARIREVTGRDVWSPPLSADQRVVIPGYDNLFNLSKSQPEILQANLGLGWPTYFRPGNYTIVWPPTRAHQARTDEELKKSLAKDYPTILWLVNFPSLSINHAVVVYALESSGAQDKFLVYDPNDAEQPKELTFDPGTRTFSFAKTFYFPGGPVDVRPVYLSPLQ